MADAVVAAEQRENDQGLHHRLASPETNTWAERRFPPIGETDCRALADYRWGSAVAGSLPRASFPPASFRFHRVFAAAARAIGRQRPAKRSEEHTSELQSLMRISYAVFCLKTKK